MIEIAYLEKQNSKVPNQPPLFVHRDGPDFHQLIDPMKVAVARGYPGIITSMKDGEDFCTYENKSVNVLELTMDGGTVVYTVYEDRVKQALTKRPIGMVGYGEMESNSSVYDCGLDCEECGD